MVCSAWNDSIKKILRLIHLKLWNDELLFGSICSHPRARNRYHKTKNYFSLFLLNDEDLLCSANSLGCAMPRLPVHVKIEDADSRS
jgi:hypothetical protein